MKKTVFKQGHNDDAIPTYLTIVTDDNGKIIEIFNKDIPLLQTAWFDGASQIHQPIKIKDIEKIPYSVYIEGL